MAVSAKTAHKLMTKKNGSNSTVWNAYADSTAYLWDQNIINEYVIAYELNSGLDYTLQDMLPKVSCDLTPRAELIFPFHTSLLLCSSRAK